MGTRRSGRDRRRCSRALALALVALAACKSKPSPPQPEAPPIPIAADAADPIGVTPESASMPGTLWFVTQGKLAQVTKGVVTTGFDDVGARIFPSPYALPDGRLVGVASRGTGDQDSEQLVLIGPGVKVERFGFMAAMVREPAIDPAGKWIVVEGKRGPDSELYKIDLATEQVAQLTNDPRKGNFAPALLGKDALVFTSSRDGDSEIYRCDFDGKHVQRLTAFHKDDWMPMPSPDGKTIAFASDREGTQRIFLVDADGTHLRRLTSGAGGREDIGTWSPDGKTFAYVADHRLRLREIANGTDREITSAGDSPELGFSPDGEWIVVTIAGDLTAFSTTSGRSVKITTGSNEETTPRWRAR